MPKLLSLLLVAAMASPAHAHLGHVGELAGHAHWIGYGALAVSAAALALLARGKKRSEETKDAEAEADDAAPEEETA